MKTSKRVGWPDQNSFFASNKRPGPLSCAPGDEVAYTVYFLRQIADGPTDPLCHRRGKVVELCPGDRARVLWNDETEPQLISTVCLSKPGPNLRYCAG